jgi:hypothetical protein
MMSLACCGTYCIQYCTVGPGVAAIKESLSGFRRAVDGSTARPNLSGGFAAGGKCYHDADEVVKLPVSAPAGTSSTIPRNVSQFKNEVVVMQVRSLYKPTRGSGR